MAGRRGKKTEEPVNSGEDFFNALADLMAEKGLSREEFLITMQNAFTSAYKKQYSSNGEVKITLNDAENKMICKMCRYVVEEVEDKDKEISVEDAKKIDPRYEAGDVIEKEFDPSAFGRVAAQAAKQVIMQKLRETDKTRAMQEFSSREGEMLEGTIRKVDGKVVYIDLGKVEGVLYESDQVKSETYTVGDRIKVYVKRQSAKNAGKNTSAVAVSRTCGELVEQLFKEVVPEIQEGKVEIKASARDAGLRTKIAIHSNDPHVDPVGACVGTKGCRVNQVVEELGGEEKVDIIVWSEDPLEFICKALSPAKVIDVIPLPNEEKSVIAVVPDDKLSLAIGRSGQNARLAVKLTGWRIDVKCESDMIGSEYYTDNPESGEEE